MEDFLVLLQKEWTQLYRSRRLGLLAALVLTLAPPTVLQSVRWLRDEIHRSEAVIEQNHHQIEISAHIEQVEKWGLFLKVPVDPLWVYDRGVWGRWGSLAHIDASGQVRWVGRQWAHEQWSVLIEPLDFTALALTLFSLMAFLTTYDAVSGERERGTWVFLLQTPVNRGTVLAAKWLGRMTPVWLAAGATWLAILVGVSATVSVPDLTAWVGGSLGVLVLTLLFLGGMGLWGVAASVWTRTSVSSLALGLVAWAVAVWVWPRTAATMAQLIRPPADPEVLNFSIVMLQKQVEPQFWKTWMLPPGRTGVIYPTLTETWHRIQEEADRQVLALRQAAERQTVRYLEVLRVLRMLSPTESFATVVSQWVGTSWLDFLRFHERAVRYGYQWREWKERLPREVKAGYIVDKRPGISDPLAGPRGLLRPHLQGLPRAIEGSLSWGERLVRVWPEAILWLAFHGILAVFTLVRFSRI